MGDRKWATPDDLLLVIHFPLAYTDLSYGGRII